VSAATGRINPRAIDRVMAVVEAESDGDHLTSHWILARKVLGESKQFAFEVATAFRHHRLTRAECEGMVSDWLTDESECQHHVSTKGQEE
jgi:hypothetical protein